MELSSLKILKGKSEAKTLATFRAMQVGHFVSRRELRPNP